MPKKPNPAPVKKPAPVAVRPVAKAPAPSKALATRASVNAEEDSGAGSESMTRKDFMIPRITILQANSPQAKKSDPAYIKGASEGSICDILNARIFDGSEGIVIIPCSYRRANVEWKPDRGGFVADHGSDDVILSACTKNDKGQMVLKSGNLVQTMAEYFVLLFDPETDEVNPFVLSMAGTQLKKSRRFNTMINQLRVPRTSGDGTFNPAIFYRAYKLTTVPEKNDKGSWFGWEIAPDSNVLDLEGGDEIYLKARALHNSVAEGTAKAVAPNESHMGTGAADESADSPM